MAANTARTHDFKATAAAALAAAGAVLSHWLPDGTPDGHEYKALNPTRADSRVGSLSINTTTGQWADFATDDKGSDFISLVSYLDDCTQGEAESRLADFLELHCKRAVTPVTAVTQQHNGKENKPVDTANAYRLRNRTSYTGNTITSRCTRTRNRSRRFASTAGAFQPGR